MPSPCVKTTPEPFILKVHRPTFGFLTFSSTKRWWQLRAFSFLGRCTREPRVALPSKGKLRQLATPLGTIRELGHSISVQCCYHDFFFIYVPFPFYLLCCPCLYITIVVLLCLVCVCLLITFIVRNIFSTPIWHLHLAHTLRY